MGDSQEELRANSFRKPSLEAIVLKYCMYLKILNIKLERINKIFDTRRM